MEVRRVDLANWALRTVSKFTTWVKYQFYQDFDHIRDPEIPITLRLMHKICTDLSHRIYYNDQGLVLYDRSTSMIALLRYDV